MATEIPMSAHHIVPSSAPRSSAEPQSVKNALCDQAYSDCQLDKLKAAAETHIALVCVCGCVYLFYLKYGDLVICLLFHVH